MISFSPSLFFLFISLALVYCIGHVLFAFMQNDAQKSISCFFFKLIIGCTVLITVYALICTHGKSVLLGAIPLLGILAWQSKISTKLFLKRLQKIDWTFLFILLAATLIVSWSWYHQVVPNSIHTDLSFYAAVGSYLHETGIESVNLDWVNTGMQAPVPYHYGEIWLSVFLSSIFNITILNGLMLVAYPMLEVFFFIGIVAFLSERLQLSLWKSFLGSLLLFCIAVFPLYFKSGLSVIGMGTDGIESLGVLKFLPLCVAFIGCLLVQSPMIKIIIGCITTLFFTSAAPGIMAGIGLYFLALLFRRDIENYWISFVFVAFTVLYSFCFYVLCLPPAPFQVETTSAFNALLQSLDHLEGFQQAGISIVQQAVNLSLNVLPYLLLLLLFTKEQRSLFGQELKRQEVSGFFILGGIMASALAYGLIDGIQLCFSITLPLQLIFFVWSLVFSFRYLRGWKLFFPFLILVGTMYLNQGSPTRKMDAIFNTELALQINKGDRFAFVQSGRSLYGANTFLRNANYIPVLPDIRWYTDSYLPVNLSVYDIPYDLDNIQDATYVVGALESSPFYRYVEKNQLNKNLKEAQNRFVTENNIRFVVVQRGLNWFEGRPFRIERVIKSGTESYDLYMISPNTETKN